MTAAAGPHKTDDTRGPGSKGASRPAPTTAQEIAAINPATGELIEKVAVTPAYTIPRLVAQARAAQERWAALSYADRAAALRGLRAAIVKHRDEAAVAISQGMGKPIGEALGHDIGLVLDTLDDYVEHAPEYLADEPIEVAAKFGTDKRALVRYTPRGVVVVIAPWNYPFGLAFDPIVTALAAGNAVLLKPTSAAPLVGVVAEKILDEAFRAFPGLVQVVHGPGELGSRLATAPGVDFVCFTGSTKVGRELSSALAPLLRPALMELGGSDPAIVTDDANLERAANGVLWGRFTNNGQVCTAIKRLYVQDTVAEAFTQKLVAKVRALKVGPYTDEDVDVGPLANARGLATLRGQLQDAIDHGARVETGGFPAEGKPGYFWPPTVLSGVLPSMRVMREEVFGPILPIQTFHTDEEAIHLANDTEYGLGAYVFCGESRRAERIANRLDAGSVDINDSVVHYVVEALPFGGIKHSGLQRYHGKVGLRLFAEMKGMLFVDGTADTEPYWFPYSKVGVDYLRKGIA
jgi:acyl-CoA reductase-like NAD-dependent aldehyde dehydrogenase